MDNLFAASRALERMPDDMLTTLVRRPNPQFPQFVVAAELQRRKQLRASAGAEQAKGTVLDALAPPSPEPQQFASGGLVAFEGGGGVNRPSLAEIYRALQAAERGLPPPTTPAPRAATAMSERFPPLGGSTSERTVQQAEAPTLSPTAKSWESTKKRAAAPEQPAGLTAADFLPVPTPNAPVMPPSGRGGAGGGGQMSAGVSASLPGEASDIGAYYKRFAGLVDIPDPTTEEIIARQQELQKALGYDFESERAELAKRRAEAGARLEGGLDSPAMRQAMLRAGLALLGTKESNLLSALGGGLGAGVETYAGEREAVKKANTALDAEERQLRRDQMTDKRGLYGIASQAMNSSAANRRQAAGLAAQLAAQQRAADQAQRTMLAQMARAGAGGSGGAGGAPGAVPIRAEDYKEIRERMAEDPQLMRAASAFKTAMDTYNKNPGGRGAEEFMRKATEAFQQAQEAARIRASAGLTYYPTKVPSGGAMPGSTNFGIDMRSGSW